MIGSLYKIRRDEYNSSNKSHHLFRIIIDEDAESYGVLLVGGDFTRLTKQMNSKEFDIICLLVCSYAK